MACVKLFTVLALQLKMAYGSDMYAFAGCIQSAAGTEEVQANLGQGYVDTALAVAVCTAEDNTDIKSECPQRAWLWPVACRLPCSSFGPPCQASS